MTVWLLVSYSPGSALATPEHQFAIEGARNSTLLLPLGRILQVTPGSLDSLLGDSAGSSPSINAAPQECMSQEVVSGQGDELLRTSLQAREGENVRFHYQKGQWYAEVSSRIGSFSRRAVLPVVCSQGADVASSLEVVNKYPSWQRQRQIHVLDRNVHPTLGEVVYVGELGLKGGGNTESSMGGEGSDDGDSDAAALRAAERRVADCRFSALAAAEVGVYDLADYHQAQQELKAIKESMAKPSIGDKGSDGGDSHESSKRSTRESPMPAAARCSSPINARSSGQRASLSQPQAGGVAPLLLFLGCTISSVVQSAAGRLHRSL